MSECQTVRYRNKQKCQRRIQSGTGKKGTQSGTGMPEFIDPVFTKTSLKRSFSLNRKRAFWLVFAKTGSIISGTDNGMPIPAASASMPMLSCGCYTSYWPWPSVSIIRISTVLLHELSQRRRSLGRERKVKDKVVYSE